MSLNLYAPAADGAPASVDAGLADLAFGALPSEQPARPPDSNNKMTDLVAIFNVYPSDCA